MRRHDCDWVGGRMLALRGEADWARGSLAMTGSTLYPRDDGKQEPRSQHLLKIQQTEKIVWDHTATAVVHNKLSFHLSHCSYSYSTGVLAC